MWCLGHCGVEDAGAFSAVAAEWTRHSSVVAATYNTTAICFGNTLSTCSCSEGTMYIWRVFLVAFFCSGGALDVFALWNNAESAQSQGRCSEFASTGSANSKRVSLGVPCCITVCACVLVC